LAGEQGDKTKKGAARRKSGKLLDPL